jgi:HlyD family secretion protein
MTCSRARRHGEILWLASLVVLSLLIAGCRQAAEPTPTPAATALPPVGVASGSSVATASGEIVPALSADLGFPTPGRVAQVLADVGDRVVAGQLLAAQDRAAAEATVSGAESALFQAQAHLVELQAGPRAQEVAAAEASVDAAKARLAQLSEGARAEEIAAARASLAAEQSALQQLYLGPSEDQRIEALAALSNAEAALQQAQAAYDNVSWRNDISGLPESRQLQEATNNYEAAKARYDALYAQPDADVLARAQAQVEQAQAALDALLTPGSENQIAEAEANVRSAQAELELLTAGAPDTEIGIAAAAVSQAKATLQNAEAMLANLELRAPFTGTVTALNINPGETTTTGQVALTMANLDHLRVQTTDLSERDVERVSPGQLARVFVDPLSEEVGGRVLQISPQASVIGGDVVYEVLVELDEQIPNLRWGMSVDVTFVDE